MHADDYAGFKDIFDPLRAKNLGAEPAKDMACIAHMRRKFVDVFPTADSVTAEAVIELIAKLYAVEKVAKGKSPEERVAMRQEHAKPVLDDLKAWF